MTRESPTREKEAAYTESQWTLIRRRFCRHRLAVASGVVLALAYVVVAFAEFFAPYDPEHRDLNGQFVPPMRVRVIAPDEGWRMPFVHALEEHRDFETLTVSYSENKEEIYPLRLFVRGDPYTLGGLFRTDLHLFGVDGPQRLYLWGTDQQARDLLSRIVIGARISLSIGLVGVAISFFLAIVLGTISGYFGGLADTVIQRLIEVLICIPSLPLWMALAVTIPLNWPVVKAFFAITVILSLMGWPGLAREVRGKMLYLRTEDFVTSAVLDNAKTRRIMFRHLIPGTLSHLIASLTLAIPGMILGETSLSFLGIGLQAPAISWGVLLQDAQNLQTILLSPWLLLPVVPIVVVILSFNFVGDGLRDAADPYKS